MRKLIFFIFLFILNSCDKNSLNDNSLNEFNNKALIASKSQSNSLTTSIQLINDSEFQNGFNVLDPSSGLVEGPLQYANFNNTPEWNLAQWYSSGSIYGASPTVLPSGSSQFANNYKAITIGPNNSTDGHLIFAINGQNEFGNTYRNATDPFPHLLADQRIADPDGWLGTQTPFIDQMSSLNFSIDALLQYHVRNQQTGYNPDIHALQFSCVFLVQNLRSGNAGYGKNMYFSIMFFDDRTTLTSLEINEDLFSGKIIYDVGLSPFTTSGMSVGTWKNINNANILPLIKDGLDEAWSRGYLTESTNYSDYKVSSFTTGFECTGLNIGTMQIKNLSLIAN